MTKSNSPKRVVGFLFNLWKIAPVMSISMIVLQIAFAILTSAIAPIFVSKLLNSIADGSAKLNNSFELLTIYFVILFVGSVILTRITIILAFIAETKMQNTVYKNVFSRLTHKSIGFHSNKMSGGIVSDAGKLNGSIERFWDSVVFNAIPITTTIVSICISLSFIFWQYAIALAILSIIVIAVIIKTQQTIVPISRTVAEKSSAITARLADVITNISAVKAFAKEDDELNSFQERLTDWRKSMLVEMKKVTIATGTFSFMAAIMNVSAFAAAIIATEYHIADIGVIYLVINYTLTIVSHIWEISFLTRTFIRIVGDASPMIDILDEKIELKDSKKPISFVVTRGEIKFNKINFTHDGNDEPLFKDFSLKIKPGEKVGLVGVSGSGKTSLTKLLLRFSDVDKGEILIDNKNIAKATQKALHQSIAYVPQEPLLFHRSIRENIAYSNVDASIEEVNYAAKQANALDFIQTLPKGMDTVVGERGVKLSGGQRQRIAIARAILKNAPILVLDEATSALDSENEILIQNALWELMSNRTSIVIAHRLSTIAKLDRIVVMENGKIIEEGSHKDLLAANGTYAKLWQHQSGGFIKM